MAEGGMRADSSVVTTAPASGRAAPSPMGAPWDQPHGTQRGEWGSFGALLSSKQGCPRFFSQQGCCVPSRPPSDHSLQLPRDPKIKRNITRMGTGAQTPTANLEIRAQKFLQPMSFGHHPALPYMLPCRTPRYGAGGDGPAPSLPFQPVSIPAELLDENAPRPRFGAQANARGCQIPPCLQLPHKGLLQGWGDFLFQTTGRMQQILH